MPYAHRPMHDADSHVMETPDWLRAHADPGVREKLPPLYLSTVKPGEEELIEQLRQLEQAGDLTARLALLEELKGLPFGAVWDYFCLQQEVPVGIAYLDEIRGYEARILSQRS